MIIIVITCPHFRVLKCESKSDSAASDNKNSTEAVFNFFSMLLTEMASSFFLANSTTNQLTFEHRNRYSINKEVKKKIIKRRVPSFLAINWVAKMWLGMLDRNWKCCFRKTKISVVYLNMAFPLKHRWHWFDAMVMGGKTHGNNPAGNIPSIFSKDINASFFFCLCRATPPREAGKQTHHRTKNTNNPCQIWIFAFKMYTSFFLPFDAR